MRRLLRVLVWLPYVCGCANLSGLTGGTDAGGDASHLADVEAGGSTDAEAEADGAEAQGADAERAEAMADAPLDSSAVDAGPCAVVYVAAASGNDTSTGCSPAEPKQTVAAALAAASAVDAGTVEVCSGVYDENDLKLGSGVSLRGGYDCSTWTSTGAPDGGAGSTILQNSSASPSPATLTIVGTAVVEGFAVQGPTAPAVDAGTVDPYAAIEVLSTLGSATISGNLIMGGGGPAASAGILVEQGASAVITGNTINGGSGVSPDGPPASAGVLVEANGGNVVMAGNTVHGGSGNAVGTAAGAGSSAVYFSPSGTIPATFIATSNTIYGGNGTVSCTGVSCYAVRPVVAVGPVSVVFADNVVQPTEPNGLPVTSGGQCPLTVVVNVTGSAFVTGNRIYGGECAVTAPVTIGEALSLNQYLGGNPVLAVVKNNMVHAGTVASAHHGTAMEIGVSGAFVLANTAIAPADGLSNGIALWLGGVASGTTVSQNILAGADVHSWGVLVECLQPPSPNVPPVVSFHDNLVFGAAAGLLHYDACPPTLPLNAYSIDDMNAALVAAGGAASGNVTIAPPACPPTADGGSDMGCVAACPAGDGGCFNTLFAGWDSASLGVQNLFFSGPVFDGGCPAVSPPSGDGWPLATTGAVPCQIVASPSFDASLPATDGGGGEAGSVADAGALTQDIYGNCRPASPSMGAAQAPTHAACL